MAAGHVLDRAESAQPTPAHRRLPASTGHQHPIRAGGTLAFTGAAALPPLTYPSTTPTLIERLQFNPNENPHGGSRRCADPPRGPPRGPPHPTPHAFSSRRPPARADPLARARLGGEASAPKGLPLACTSTIRTLFLSWKGRRGLPGFRGDERRRRRSGESYGSASPITHERRKREEREEEGRLTFHQIHLNLAPKLRPAPLW